MIKQVLLLCSIILLSSLCSSTAIAGNSTSSIGVKMKITHANCTVNGGKGISGAYNLPLMNESGNVTDRVSATDVPLIIDFSKGVKPSALTISFTAATPGFQNAAKGLVNTTMANIALLTRWKRNGASVIDLSTATDILSVKDAEIQPSIYDSSFKVYPTVINTASASLTPGRYQADLTINITYY